MDGAPGRPAGQVLKITPPACPHNEDDHVALEISNVEAGSSSDSSLPKAATNSIDSQEHLQNNDIQITHLVHKHSANQPCASAKTCVGAMLELDSKKRKSPMPSLSMPTKKIRVDEDTAHLPQSSDSHQLPAEIWQHIFTFLPPKMLGRLLSVDKCFNHFLHPSSKFSCRARPSVVTGVLSTLRPEVIWQFSRRRFWPTMPTPLRDHTELQMWQLACQNKCQSCGSTIGQPISPGSDPSNVENRDTIPRPIWPFALTSCAACLAKVTIMEVSLLLSSHVPSFLIPALPFIFIDDNMSVISSAMLQTGQTPITSRITKYFLSSHVAAIQEEFDSVRRLGEATAEEWVKGLDGRGKERRADSLRWEKFEMSGGLTRIRQRLSSQDPGVNGESNELLKGSRISKPCSNIEGKGEPVELLERKPSSATTLTSAESLLTRTRESSISEPVSEHQIRLQANAVRSKTRERAEEMKAARRADIESRAMRLEPPIPAQALALIPAFRAAIQITSPLSDTAWELLKPRLIAQRKDLDKPLQSNQGAAAKSQSACVKSEDAHDNKTLALENKQKADKDWDDAQVSLRARISALADEIIGIYLKKGPQITKKSCPQFAADVLLRVKEQFYTEITKEDASGRAAGRPPISDAQNGPYTRKLTLEHMKWVFDVKVKPFTEPYGKELFYCHGCQNSSKMYGFEGVVQHFSAKHTKSLSRGNIVVYWRAEWPKVPPFHPEPDKLKNQEAGNSTFKSTTGVLTDAASTARGQPFHQGEVLPTYRHSMPHDRYDAIQTQAPYMRGSLMTRPNEYLSPLSLSQGQAHHHVSDSQLSRNTTYQGLPEFPRGAVLFGPVETPDLHAHHGHGYSSHQNHANSEPQFYGQSQPLDDFPSRQDDIVRNAIILWGSLSVARELPKPIRIFVLIHHVVTKFRKRFSEELPFYLFVNVLSGNREMRPIRNVSGLGCKVCRLDVTRARDAAQKTYSLLQLVKHFQPHVEQLRATGAPELDWRTEMIDQPDLFGVLSNLSDAKTLGNSMRSRIKHALLELVSINSQRTVGQGPANNSLFSDYEDLDRRSHLPAAHVSKQRGPRHQPHTRHPETTRYTGQRESGLRAQNARRNMPKASQSPSIPLMGLPQAVHQHTYKAYTGAATPKAEANTNIPSALVASAGNHDENLPINVENDEDDDFDLFAGLESQLAQQASSIRPDISRSSNK